MFGLSSTTVNNIKKTINRNDYKEKILDFIQESFIINDVNYCVKLDSLQDDDSFEEGSQYLTFGLSKNPTIKKHKLDDFIDVKETAKLGKKVYNIQTSPGTQPSSDKLLCFTFRDYDNFDNEKQLFRDLIEYKLKLKRDLK